ncbi:MAG: hypothetical protein LWX83_08905 [Anaerolineae bacterium]|nr:hypothetical protein [Anaerolineae bacterium]
MLPEKLRDAIHLVRAGEKDRARKLLMEILENDPTNETAWLWFVDTLESDREKVIALKGLIKINPKSQAARLGLKRLTGEAIEEPLLQAVETEVKQEIPQTETDVVVQQPVEEIEISSPPRHVSRRFEKQWLLVALLVGAAVFLVGIFFFFFADQMGFGTADKTTPCSCAETDAYLTRVQDRVSRWLSNQAIYEIAEKNGDAPSNTDFAQKIYQEEQDDRVPECLIDLHATLLVAFEYHVKYGEALRGGNAREISYYRDFVVSTREQLRQDFAQISSGLNCTK